MGVPCLEAQRVHTEIIIPTLVYESESQQSCFHVEKLMRHSDIRTTMNIYGDAVTNDIRRASRKVARIALAVT